MHIHSKVHTCLQRLLQLDSERHAQRQEQHLLFVDDSLQSTRFTHGCSRLRSHLNGPSNSNHSHGLRFAISLCCSASCQSRMLSSSTFTCLSSPLPHLHSVAFKAAWSEDMCWGFPRCRPTASNNTCFLRSLTVYCKGKSPTCSICGKQC